MGIDNWLAPLGKRSQVTWKAVELSAEIPNIRSTISVAQEGGAHLLCYLGKSK